MSSDPLDHDNPDAPVERSDDLARVKRAYAIACMNLTELADHRTRLLAALEGALLLLDNIVADMRNKGVEPSVEIVSFKAGFDKGMRELLGKDR